MLSVNQIEKLARHNPNNPYHDSFKDGYMMAEMPTVENEYQNNGDYSFLSAMPSSMPIVEDEYSHNVIPPPMKSAEQFNRQLNEKINSGEINYNYDPSPEFIEIQKKAQKNREDFLEFTRQAKAYSNNKISSYTPNIDRDTAQLAINEANNFAPNSFDAYDKTRDLSRDDVKYLLQQQLNAGVPRKQIGVRQGGQIWREGLLDY